MAREVGEAVREKRCLTRSETLGEEAIFPSFEGLSKRIGDAGGKPLGGDSVRLLLILLRGRPEGGLSL